MPHATDALRTGWGRVYHGGPPTVMELNSLPNYLLSGLVTKDRSDTHDLKSFF